jgi:hypothetical protein
MHPILEEGPTMADRAEFADEITLGRREVFDVVARCDEVVERAGEIGESAWLSPSTLCAGCCSGG